MFWYYFLIKKEMVDLLRDRGTLKWTAMMLPEHVQSLKEVLIDEEKIDQPILDEQHIEEFEILIYEAMEYNWTLTFKVFDNGFVNEIKGSTHYFDSIKKQLRIKDGNNHIHYVFIKDLIDVYSAQ